MECYRSADIILIEERAAEQLPETDLETVAAAYSEVVRKDRIREMLGIPGPGPWRIVLAGYVINALARPDQAIRDSAHLPSSAEKDFPVH